MYKQKIDEWINTHEKEILELNKSLVSIPSVNKYPTGNEAEVQKFIESTLRNLGCETDVFIPTDVQGLTEHKAYLGERHYENRPNVVGVKKGSGGGKSIMFSGHVDTVPEGVDPWIVDPYSGSVIDGKQYGLGLLDMKGGIAASIMAMTALDDMGITLKGDFIIETVVDEEYGGSNGTLASRLKGYEADVAIIPEPSNMIICPTNQGGLMMRITFSGRAGRSFSGEELLNPIHAASRFIGIFNEYEKYRGQMKSINPLYENSSGLPTYIQGIKAGPIDAPLTDRVPSSCSIDVWFQCYPETTEEELRNDLIDFYQEKAKDDSILQQMPAQFEKLIRFIPGSSIPDNHPIIDVAKAASEKFGKKLPVEGAPFACDSFMFNLHSNTPALIWGPKGVNAHGSDEHIFIDDFMELIKMYALTIIKWCGIKK